MREMIRGGKDEGRGRKIRKERDIKEKISGKEGKETRGKTGKRKRNREG